VKLLIAVFSFAALAQAQEGFLHLPAAKIKGFPASLQARQAAKKSATGSEQLANLGNYTMMAIRRDASGDPEIHASWNDIFIAQDGEATLIYGGKVEGGRETAPGETRGGKIVGGKTQKIAAGEMAVIPAGMPHQTTLEPGKSFTYMVVKVEKK